MGTTKKFIGIVVPSIRENCFKEFCDKWINHIHISYSDYKLNFYLVEDNDKKSFKVNKDFIKLFNYFRHYSHKEILEDLKDNSWIIPFNTDCVRSYGYYKAYQDGCDYIITLDDDCYPLEKYNILDHIASLMLNVRSTRWQTTLVDGAFPRGYPYELKHDYNEVMINHGLWTNVLDLDAPTQLIHGELRYSMFLPSEDKIIPYGIYYPNCGMNLSWKREMTKYMYFMLMGKSYPFDRFGDIFCGIVAKKVCDTYGWSVRSGTPYIYHSRASNVFDNLIKEAKGIKYNEVFWKVVDRVKHNPNRDIYLDIAEEIGNAQELDLQYFKMLSKSMKVWFSLFENGKN